MGTAEPNRPNRPKLPRTKTDWNLCAPPLLQLKSRETETDWNISVSWIFLIVLNAFYKALYLILPRNSSCSVLNLDHSEKVQLLKEAVASSKSSLGPEEVATVASSSNQPLSKRQKLLQKHSVGTTKMLEKEILGYLAASADFNASQDEFWRENFGKNANAKASECCSGSAYSECCICPSGKPFLHSGFCSEL